ncbi:hypothetical protein PGT21_023709 [Puccinia graminis f. sp. tritici]|uniref:Tet-like 2OG-Fe(II) oxygenase domain-containing protein n=1 Tax=Puccinia graminis f. sp. tritici TaxID=56615 RepID=A0A5B0MY89_PUCGR|nr:hypothetical protein PGT21_023709 [Puccinia graminis f. sp. tritici]
MPEIPTCQVLKPRFNQAEHEFNPQHPAKYISQEIMSSTSCVILNIDQMAPHEDIKCPDVKQINPTQQFLDQAKHKIQPDKPTVIFTNSNRELGLFVKQTRWSDMPPEEYEEIKFLTTTLVQLGHYYNNQSNSSLLEGVMKGFGWRKGYGQDMEHFGTYTPAKVKTEEDYREWRALLLQLPMVESIISRRFQKLAPGAFHQSVEKMKSAKIPSFASPEFDQVPSLPFASNLTATWGEFYNRAHIDNDVSSISYGGWCGIHRNSGQPASKEEGFDIEYGQFFLPGISTVVDFNAIDGWTDLFWASNLLYHQTVRSKRPHQSLFDRFAFSVQINKSLHDACLSSLGKTGQTIGGFSARDAQVRRLIQGFYDPTIKNNPDFPAHSSPLNELSEATEYNNDDDFQENDASALPEPVWPEVSNESTSAQKPDPPPQAVTPGGYLNDPEVSIISAKEFLDNIKAKAQRLEVICKDTSIPLSARRLMRDAMKIMIDSSTTVQQGKSLPEDEEVRIGNKNLLGKRNKSSTTRKPSKKMRHRFTSGDSEKEGATEKDKTSNSEKDNPNNEVPDDPPSVPDQPNPNPVMETSEGNHQVTQSSVPVDSPSSLAPNPTQAVETSEENRQNPPSSTDGCDETDPIQQKPKSPSRTTGCNESTSSKKNNNHIHQNAPPLSRNEPENSNPDTNPTSILNSNQSVSRDSTRAEEVGIASTDESTPITLKYRTELSPIHELYAATISYNAYHTAFESINQLYSSRTNGLLPPTAYSSFLSSRIEFKPVNGTSLKIWLKNLRREGPDLISPGFNEPFYKTDVWCFPSKTSISSPPSQSEMGSELFTLFTHLCHPAEAVQCKWAAILFQSIALVAKDISSLPVYNKPTDPANELGPELAIIEYFIQCLSGPDASHEITDSTSSKEKENKISFSTLDKFIDNIHQMLIAFAVLKAKCKLHKNEKSLMAHSEKWNRLPKEHISRPHYQLLASFCVSGIRGLFLSPSDSKLVSASKCFLLISVVAKVNSFQPPPKNYDYEPVWKRTNAYICSIINSAFFSSDDFTPTRISRYDLAKYIVLDFSEHWLEFHPGGEQILNVPKRSGCPGATIKDL